MAEFCENGNETWISQFLDLLSREENVTRQVCWLVIY